jgi:hypothetical protein
LKNSLKKINNEYGVSAITPFRKDYILTGNYSGIFVYKKENNTLKFIKKMNLIVCSNIVNYLEFFIDGEIHYIKIL